MNIFDKQLWIQNNFSSKNPIPNWPCPTCTKGILLKDGESISITNTKETNAAYNPVYDTTAKAEFRFNGYLKCNYCSDKIMISGTGKYFDVFDNKEVLAVYRGKKYMVYYPTHFQPELLLLSFPSSLKSEIKSLLHKSFNHYWYDLDACANKIRQAIELIVDDRTVIRSNLDQKIQSLRKSLGEDLTNTILALKWIGNEGSHAGRPFEKEEILDAYSLLEDVLHQLYPDSTEQARKLKLVQKINSNKGLKKA